MNKLNKIALIVVLILGMIYESVVLISQCNAKKSIDISRQISCNGALGHALTSCTENASVVLKSISSVEFLLITNHLGNPVLTLIDLFVLIVAFATAIKIKTDHGISRKELIAIRNILGLILIRLCVQWFCVKYTVNWFKGNPVYNNTGFTVNEDTTSLLWFCVVLILIIWSDYLRLEIKKNMVEQRDVSV